MSFAFSCCFLCVLSLSWLDVHLHILDGHRSALCHSLNPRRRQQLCGGEYDCLHSTGLRNARVGHRDDGSAVLGALHDGYPRRLRLKCCYEACNPLALWLRLGSGSFFALGCMVSRSRAEMPTTHRRLCYLCAQNPTEVRGFSRSRSAGSLRGVKTSSKSSTASRYTEFRRQRKMQLSRAC